VSTIFTAINVDIIRCIIAYRNCSLGIALSLNMNRKFHLIGFLGLLSMWIVCSTRLSVVEIEFLNGNEI